MFAGSRFYTGAIDQAEAERRFRCLSDLTLTCCGISEIDQISRSFSSNSGAILLKRPKNLIQIGYPSLRSVKPDRLLETKPCLLDRIEFT